MSWKASVTEDEPQHNDHGKRLLAWYMGKDQTAVKSPFDDNGVWLIRQTEVAINIYGGFFDLLGAFLYKAFFHRLMDEFEFRHILSALFGAALLLFIGLIAYRITDNWKVAFLTLVIATFTPRLIGNSLSNPKDIPLATFFAFSLLQIISFIREMPRVRIRTLLLLSLSFILALAVRSGAIILIFYFILFTGLYTAWLLYTKEIARKGVARMAMYVAGISLVGYFGCSLLWPWDLQNPLMHPLKSLSVFKNFNAFDSFELFQGAWVSGKDNPWYFVPQWLYITLPITVIVGLIFFFVLLPSLLRTSVRNTIIYALLVFSAVFPLLSIIISHSNIYNGARHVIFVIPSIVAIAGLGWGRLLQVIRDAGLKLSAAAALFILLLEPALFIVNNNPVQAMYFSPLIGGCKGAFKNYEMDYYGYCIRPAVDWIEQNDTIYKSGRKAKVRMWYGEQMKLEYCTKKSEHQEYVAAEENSTAWDYSIQLPAEAKYNKDIIYHWPPKGTVHEVMAGDAPLCAIIKNYRIPSAPANGNGSSNNAAASADPSMQFISSGIAFYNAKDFNKAIVEFKKAQALNPQNIYAYNNLVSAYNELSMYDDAIAVGKAGLLVSPDFQMLKNNLAVSLKAAKTFTYSEKYYINASYCYYMQGDYQKCIDAAKLILKYNPNNTMAWNNICSAYNAMGEYKKATDACNSGLKLDPTNKLLNGNKGEAARLMKLAH